MSSGWLASRRFGKAGLVLATAVLLAGLATSWLVFAALRDGVSQHLADATDQRLSAVRSAVAGEMQRYVDTLSTLASALEARPDPTAAEFTATTASLATERLPGAAGVGLVVPVPEGRVAAAQAYWRARGSTGLVLHPERGVTEHLFGVLSRRLDGTVGRNTGRDLATLPETAEAAVLARRTGQVAASRTYVLVRDQHLPAARRQLSFTLAAPIYSPAGSGGAPVFRGWVSMSMRGGDFLTATLRDVAQGAANVTLADASTGRDVPVAAVRSGPALRRGGLDRTVALTVGQQRWLLHLQPTTRVVPGGVDHQAEGALGAGAAISVLLAGLVLSLVTTHDRVVARVDRATREIGAREAYLEQVMDSVPVTISTVDTEGRIVHANRFADEVTGTVGLRGVSTPELTAQLRVTAADGVTPVDPQNMATPRALRGETVDGLEIVLHPPGAPPRTVVLHARPLRDPDGQIVGAVTAGHDITTLRQREAELQAFAAVAAHDLRSPLATLTAYAELFRTDHAESLSPQALDDLRRIQDGAYRMQTLLGDMLTYASARDARLDLRPVDLHRLATEIAAERCAYPAELPPQVRVGPLPTVTADAGMMRQLLDNLIGNACKYVAPGTSARVEVTATRDSDRWRIEVADNGIGVPAEQREVIFGTFTRGDAARTYPGTGLGLAICRRIVERHHGTIDVADNPGGGSRFSFTLGHEAHPPSVAACAGCGADRTSTA